LSPGPPKLLTNSRKFWGCFLSKFIQFSITVYGLLSNILNVLSSIRSRIHMSHRKSSQKIAIKILNYRQHTYFRLWGMPGRFLDISHLWGSIFNGQIVSNFCNPPLQFNDIDTRQLRTDSRAIPPPVRTLAWLASRSEVRWLSLRVDVCKFTTGLQTATVPGCHNKLSCYLVSWRIWFYIS